MVKLNSYDLAEYFGTSPEYLRVALSRKGYSISRKKDVMEFIRTFRRKKNHG